MSTPNQLAVPQEALVGERVTGSLSARTVDILARRRRSVRRRGWLVRRMLLLADLGGLIGAFLLAEIANSDSVASAATEFGLFCAMLPVWVVTAKLYGLYDHDEERTDHSTADDLGGVLHMVTLGAWVFFSVIVFTGATNLSFTKLFVFWAAAVGLVTVSRAGARGYCRRSVTYVQNTVIVGAGEVGQLVARKLLQHREYGINLVGFIDAQPKERREDLESLTILGVPEQLPMLVRLFDIERVIVAFSTESHEEVLDLIRSLDALDVQIDIVPRLFEILAPRTRMHTVEGVPVMGLGAFRISRSSRLLKRTMDFVVSFAALVLLAPLLIAVAIAIKLDSPGPVFFRQVRMGAGDKTFKILKFRTMIAGADEQKDTVRHLNKHASNGGDPRMFKVRDDPRVTRVGRVLRRFSLDELPQLLNVVSGEMSLVGPRPLILDEDRHVIEWARKRGSIRPGVTGLWQVLGRNDIPFQEMVKLDYLYVTNWSLRNDIGLILRTIPEVFRHRGAY